MYLCFCIYLGRYINICKWFLSLISQKLSYQPCKKRQPSILSIHTHGSVSHTRLMQWIWICLSSQQLPVVVRHPPTRIQGVHSDTPYSIFLYISHFLSTIGNIPTVHMVTSICAFKLGVFLSKYCVQTHVQIQHKVFNFFNHLPPHHTLDFFTDVKSDITMNCSFYLGHNILVCFGLI